jgi:hypothetical protein
MKRRRFLSLNALASVGLAGEWPVMGSPVTTQPAPNQTGLVFLFQGDSITDGNRGRTADPNHIMGHGYAFGIASRVGAPCWSTIRR